MSWVKDQFFGGAEKKAAQAQQQNLEEGQQLIQQGVREATQKVESLFPQAQQAALGGFQSALDVFGQTIPQQGQVFQQGNIGAQQALLSGLPQQMNALLGGQVDLSGIQPVQVQADFGFAQQQLPTQLQNILNPPQPEAVSPPATPQFTNLPNGVNFDQILRDLQGLNMRGNFNNSFFPRGR